MSVSEVDKLLDIEIPEGDYDTLSGYLIEELGYIPQEKDRPTVESDQAIYKVEKVEDMRIAKVKATIKPKPVEEELDEEENKDEE